MSVEGQVIHKLNINCTAEVFCIRFSPDGKFLAAGCADGAIRVYNSQNGSLVHTLLGGPNVNLATTALRFRPVTAAARTKNVFVAANASGIVQHWHMTSAKVLNTSEEEGNQVNGADYNDEGTKYITAGKDAAIRVYDEATKTLLLKMVSGGDSKAPLGHTNRIQACKVMHGEENVVISGGWDDTVLVWDIRTGGAVRAIHGPHICGDALDVVGNEIVTGSWKPDGQLEVWDLGTGDKIRDVSWGGSGSTPCMLYSAQFSKGESPGRFIVAGGSIANEAKVFDRTNHFSPIASITGLSRGVFSMDLALDCRKWAVVSGDATIRVLEITA